MLVSCHCLASPAGPRLGRSAERRRVGITCIT
jgi:hypothetical protein